MKIIGFLQPWSARRKIDHLPAVSVKTQTNDVGSLTSPNPAWAAVIFNAAGEQVGEAAYGLPPRSDQVYVYRIEVAEHVRCRGYGLAFLLLLHNTYHTPITPIFDSHSADRFWEAARALRPVGLLVTPGLSWVDMLNEQARWRHLQAEINGSMKP